MVLAYRPAPPPLSPWVAPLLLAIFPCLQTILSGQCFSSCGSEGPKSTCSAADLELSWRMARHRVLPRLHTSHSTACTALRPASRLSLGTPSQSSPASWMATGASPCNGLLTAFLFPKSPTKGLGACLDMCHGPCPCPAARLLS